MTSTLSRIVSALVLFGLASPVSALENRHQFIEPIQPAKPRHEADDTAPHGKKTCYCQTIHQRNAVGRLTWKVICTELKPEHGARKVFADDCGAIQGLPPS